MSLSFADFSLPSPLCISHNFYFPAIVFPGVRSNRLPHYFFPQLVFPHTFLPSQHLVSQLTLIFLSLIVDIVWKFQIAPSPSVFLTSSLYFICPIHSFPIILSTGSLFPILLCFLSLFGDIVCLVLMDHLQISTPRFHILLHHNHCFPSSLSFPPSPLLWKYLFFIRPSLEIVPHPSFPLSVSLYSWMLTWWGESNRSLWSSCTCVKSQR